MISLALIPHCGIGPIRFGDNRDAVRHELDRIGIKWESHHGNSDYFGNAEIQVEYEADGTASFIGVNSNVRFNLSFAGVELFDIEARKVFELFSGYEGSVLHEFSENEYLFPNQIVTLYQADLQYDHKRARTRKIWGQIGCGDIRYIKAVQRLS